MKLFHWHRWTKWLETGERVNIHRHEDAFGNPLKEPIQIGVFQHASATH